jgi:hypothetical protein
MREEFSNSVQTRSEINGIQHYDTLEQAFRAAEKDSSIWKISFYHYNSFYQKGDRIRLVRSGFDLWRFEPYSLAK